MNKIFVRYKWLSIIFLIVANLYGLTPQEAYKKAKSYEMAGDIKKALEYYKLSAKISLNKSKDIETSKGVENTQVKADKQGVFQEPEKRANPFSSWQIQPYKKNYILLATYDRVRHSDRKRVETKFQISFKKKLLANFLGSKGSLYFGYTQLSFWQITEKSSPFRETNYAPEFFVSFPYNGPDIFLKRYKVGILHQSNGRGGLSSRSWNRIYLQGFFEYKGLKIMPRVWYRIPEKTKSNPLDASGDDNPDIWNYLGYGDIVLTYPYKRQVFSLTLKNNLKIPQNKGSVQFDWNFPLLINNGVYGYLQIFSGYGESLIDYNVRNNKIGIGFAILR